MDFRIDVVTAGKEQPGCMRFDASSTETTELAVVRITCEDAYLITSHFFFQ